MKFHLASKLGFLSLFILVGCPESNQLIPDGDAGRIDSSTPPRVDTGVEPDTAVPPEDGGSTGTPCGDNTCYAGEFCCNESCGICAAEGGACIEIACNDGVFCNAQRCDSDSATCCPGCSPGESFCSDANGACPELDCPAPTCSSDSECNGGSCCLGCNGDAGYCADACPDIACPPPPSCAECGPGLTCCPGCDGDVACYDSNGACPPVACPPPPPTCEDTNACAEGQRCCPGCLGDHICADGDGPCPVLRCPPPPVTCDSVDCPDDSQCCERCGGAPFCFPAGEMCPVPVCPPPPPPAERCEDGSTCADGLQCCAGCDNSYFCASAAGECPQVLCPVPPPNPSTCPAQEARGVGFCAAFFGYAWNGRSCVGLSGCSCEGDDCDSTYDSPEACERAHYHCPGCSADFMCETNEYCDGCAHGSCPECDDCVADCVRHDCRTEERPTCRALRPDCGDAGVAVVRDGCWLCVDRRTCEPQNVDCRTTGCADNERCARCDGGDVYMCLGEGVGCAVSPGPSPQP